MSKKDSETSEVGLPAPPHASLPAETLVSKPFMLVGDPFAASQESSLVPTVPSDSEADLSERQSKESKEPPKKEQQNTNKKKRKEKKEREHEKQKKAAVAHREAADFLSSGEEAAVGEVLAKELPRDRKKHKAKKKPAAASKVSHEKAHVLDSKKNKGNTGGSKKGEKEGNVEVQGKKLKSSFKHRRTSAAYHAAKLQAVRAGKSEAEAKALARAAWQKTASEIDAGLVKPL